MLEITGTDEETISKKDGRDDSKLCLANITEINWSKPGHVEAPAAAKSLAKSAGRITEKETSSDRIIAHTAHRDGKWVALTFDDGPHPIYTPQILKILKDNGVPATFCLVGQQVKRYPELARQIAADGHKVADHTISHDQLLPKRNDEKIRAEILGGKKMIESVIPGAQVEYYRAPGGNWSKHVREMAASWGMKSLGWSVDTRDWQRPGVASILDKVQKQLRPGGVILMHDGGGNRSQTVEALRQVIPVLRKQGYKFDFPQ